MLNLSVYYMRDHVTTACDSIDVVENTTDYDNDVILKQLEMVPVKGDDKHGWINVLGPMTIKSNNIVTRNEVYQDIVLFKIKAGQRLYIRLNFEKGCGKNHTKWNHFTGFDKKGNAKLLI